jgi:hypothetical protein
MEKAAAEDGIKDSCETIRLLCAYSLALGYDLRGIEVLVDLTGSGRPMISHPPIRACDFACIALEMLTDISFGVDELGDPNRRAAINHAWRVWYEGNAQLPHQVWKRTKS